MQKKRKKKKKIIVYVRNLIDSKNNFMKIDTSCVNKVAIL